MMSIPIPPHGFIPWDSEEAQQIDGNQIVNYCYTTRYDYSDLVWFYDRHAMSHVRNHDPDEHENWHVQIPPPVEFRDTWDWEEILYPDDSSVNIYLLKNGTTVGHLKPGALSYEELDELKAALNSLKK